jgi:hypothetical protein
MLNHILISTRTTIRQMSSTSSTSGTYTRKYMKNRFNKEISRWIAKQIYLKKVTMKDNTKKTHKT